MKNLKEYLTEAKAQDVLTILMGDFFCGAEECEEESKYDELKDIVSDFLKDVKSIKQLNIESSTVDYWKDYGVSTKIKQNDDVEDDVKAAIDDPDWEEDDVFSLKIDGNVLLMTAVAGEGWRGPEYYDVKITKIR